MEEVRTCEVIFKILGDQEISEKLLETDLNLGFKEEKRVASFAIPHASLGFDFRVPNNSFPQTGLSHCGPLHCSYHKAGQSALLLSACLP